MCDMEQASQITELVEKARQGDKESLEQVAAWGRERLRECVFRLTLDDALTEDIVQESLLDMVKVLGKRKSRIVSGRGCGKWRSIN